MTTFHAAPTESSLAQIESLQDEVLLRLDELNDRLESLLRNLGVDDSSFARDDALALHDAN